MNKPIATLLDYPYVLATQINDNPVLGLKKKLFVSCKGPEKNRIGRSVKTFFFHYFHIGQKCVFYACFTLIGSLEGGKNFGVGIFLNKNLLG